MRKITFILFIISSLNFFSQKTNKTYLAKGHNYSTIYSYDVTEIILYSDSTYIRKDYSLYNKKLWRKYREYQPEISKGKFYKKGKFYVLNRYINGQKTDLYWNVKITKNRLIYFVNEKNGKLFKGRKFKRIKNN